MFEVLNNWATQLVNSNIPGVALFFVSFLESVFFPIPPDFLLISLCLMYPALSILYALNCTVGSVLGGVTGYFLGRKFGKPLLIKFISEKKFDRVKNIFDKYGLIGVGIAGFTPIPYKVFTISAGIFQLNLLGFIIISFISRGMRFFMVGILLYFYGDKAKILIQNNLNEMSLLFGVVVILIWVLIHSYKSRKRKSYG